MTKSPKPKKQGLRLHNYLVDELNFSVVNKYIEMYRKDEKVYYMMHSVIEKTLKRHKKKLDYLRKKKVSLENSFKDGSYTIPKSILLDHEDHIKRAKAHGEELDPIIEGDIFKKELSDLNNLINAVESNPLCGMDKEALSLYKAQGKDMKAVLSTLISYCYPKMQTLKLDTEETDNVIFNLNIAPQ